MPCYMQWVLAAASWLPPPRASAQRSTSRCAAPTARPTAMLARLHARVSARSRRLHDVAAVPTSQPSGMYTSGKSMSAGTTPHCPPAADLLAVSHDIPPPAGVAAQCWGKCPCPCCICSAQYAPVCGVDNMTYGNVRRCSPDMHSAVMLYLVCCVVLAHCCQPAQLPADMHVYLAVS